MRIAIEGCAHGELDNIYESIRCLEEAENVKVDLLICCGDFQSARNEEDLNCMAVPAKYQDLRTFYTYYSGEKTAPVLTIFIGGNHEASNYLQELPYGGWVAPNIYYMGYGSVVNVGGVRIGGLSGIYKGRDYMKGHCEVTPYSDDTKRSVYHIRNAEVFRFKQISEHVDIFLSHDWPNDVFKHGNVHQLLRYKPFFRDDIENEKIGSPPCQEVLELLKPTYWFAAHLHCKFAALIPHDDDSVTKFLALDKCLPNKRFLQLVDVPHDASKGLELHYDLEWLTILHLTNHLTSVRNTHNYMPGPNGNERWDFTPSSEEMDEIRLKFGNDLKIPLNFVKTARAFDPNNPVKTGRQPPPKLNAQTKAFCSKLAIDDPLEVLLRLNGIDVGSSFDESASDQSTLDDSGQSYLNSSHSFQISPMQRLTLTLPEPKDDTKRNLDFDDMPIKAPSDNSQISIVPDIIEEVSSERNLTMSGKIKRRNANIYEDE